MTKLDQNAGVTDSFFVPKAHEVYGSTAWDLEACKTYCTGWPPDKEPEPQAGAKLKPRYHRPSSQGADFLKTLSQRLANTKPDDPVCAQFLCQCNANSTENP